MRVHHPGMSRATFTKYYLCSRPFMHECAIRLRSRQVAGFHGSEGTSDIRKTLVASDRVQASF